MIKIAGGILLALFVLWLIRFIIGVAASMAEEARLARGSRRNHEELSKLFAEAEKNSPHLFDEARKNSPHLFDEVQKNSPSAKGGQPDRRIG